VFFADGARAQDQDLKPTAIGAATIGQNVGHRNFTQIHGWSLNAVYADFLGSD
jgi:hypothetical protein